MPFLRGEISPPGDKSITHRALLFSSLVKGRVHIEHALLSGDTRSTAKALAKLGLSLNIDDQGAAATIDVVSPGYSHLKEQSFDLSFDCGNSGTTIRLLSGLCAGLKGTFRFDGDASLRRRDMTRVLDPLGEMGVKVSYQGAAGHAPFTINCGETPLKSGDFPLPVSSAQVETALILAALGAESGETRVSTPYLVRDHSYRALSYLGAPISLDRASRVYTVKPLLSELAARDFVVPGDISSSAFFLVAAAILPGSELLLKNVGINPGRTLVLDTLRRMGASISAQNEREVCGEPVCDLFVQSRAEHRLQGVKIEASQVPSGIDELPALALAFAFAEGTSLVEGALELKQKESDRLRLLTENLSNAGALVVSTEDGFVIEGRGGANMKGGGLWSTALDHRLAMLGIIASLACEAPCLLEETESMAVSYPRFQLDLETVYLRET